MRALPMLRIDVAANGEMTGAVLGDIADLPTDGIVRVGDDSRLGRSTTGALFELESAAGPIQLKELLRRGEFLVERGSDPAERDLFNNFGQRLELTDLRVTGYVELITEAAMGTGRLISINRDDDRIVLWDSETLEPLAVRSSTCREVNSVVVLDDVIVIGSRNGLCAAPRFDRLP